MQGSRCRNLDMHEKLNAWWKQCWLCFVLWLFYASRSQLFHESEECHIYRGPTYEMSISLTFSFIILLYACLNSQVSEKLEMFGKSVQGTKIVVQTCLHTPFKGEAICEYQVEKHKNPENSPILVYGKRVWGYWSMNVRVRYSHETHETTPILVYTKYFDQTMGFISEDGDLWAFGWQIQVRLTKLPQFWCLEKNLNGWGMLFQKR